MPIFYVTKANDTSKGNYPNNTYQRPEIVQSILSNGDGSY